MEIQHRSDINLVLITSVLKTLDVPFIYYPVRSVYPWKERFKQLKETISSIKARVPNAFVVLIEGTRRADILHPDMLDAMSYLRSNVDLLHVMRDTSFVDGNKKLLGEASMIREFLMSQECADVLMKHKVRSVAKISGRYRLSSTFDLNLFDMSKSKVYASGDYPRWINTRYYVMSPDLLPTYVKDINSLMSDPNILNGDHEPCLETIQFHYAFKPEQIEMSAHSIRVEGNISIHGGWVADANA